MMVALQLHIHPFGVFVPIAIDGSKRPKRVTQTLTFDRSPVRNPVYFPSIDAGVNVFGATNRAHWGRILIQRLSRNSIVCWPALFNPPALPTPLSTSVNQRYALQHNQVLDTYCSSLHKKRGSPCHVSLRNSCTFKSKVCGTFVVASKNNEIKKSRDPFSAN